MLNTIIKVLKSKISVYDGISPELLATISLGQGVKGNTHIEMIDSLKKNNIIQSQQILSALKELDRRHFTN